LSPFNTHPVRNETRYLRVRAAFLIQGTSLHGWCEKNGVAMQNVRAALLGIWRGPKAYQMVAKVLLAAGVDPE
tara:strand:- start:138 stop:356 length:219 start_codon:yes stop_codon:yes gene_type:complete